MERFSRIERLIGKDALEKLKNSHVTIAGLGAVGGYAAEALCRAGIGNFRLIDFDIVELTNLNRQIHATESTLGKPKVEVVKEKLIDINPNCKIETLKLFIHTDTMDEVLEKKIDILIDAIDSFNPKVELLTACYNRKIPTISSMGAALHRDPSRIMVADIKKTKMCGLAKSIRKRLRKRGINRGITCIFSDENINFDFIEPENDDSKQEITYERGRKRRILGSLPTIPGIFGLMAANLAIEKLIEETKEKKNG
jgi:tRNA A37 threonylcarbamoyladenosine dehydratase